MRVTTVLFLAFGASTGFAARFKVHKVDGPSSWKGLAGSAEPRCGGEVFAYVPGAGSQVQYEKDGIWNDGTLFGQETTAKDGELRVTPAIFKNKSLGYFMGPVRRKQGVATLVVGSKAEVKLPGGSWVLATIVDVNTQGIFLTHVDGWDADAIYAKDSTQIRVPSDGTGVPPPECVMELGIGSCVEIRTSSGKWLGGRIMNQREVAWQVASGHEKPGWKVFVQDWKKTYGYDVKDVRPAGADTMTVGTQVNVKRDPKKPRFHGIITGVKEDGRFLVQFDDWTKPFPFADVVKFIHLSDAANACQAALESIKQGIIPAACDYRKRGQFKEIEKFAQDEGVTLEEAALEELCDSLRDVDVC